MNTILSHSLTALIAFNAGVFFFAFIVAGIRKKEYKTFNNN